jgi:hypothetical protein
VRVVFRSELNYPIGPKAAIDMGKKGLRWDVPLYILDALFYATEGRTTVRITLSAESEDLLSRIKQKACAVALLHFVALVNC